MIILQKCCPTLGDGERQSNDLLEDGAELSRLSVCISYFHEYLLEQLNPSGAFMLTLLLALSFAPSDNNPLVITHVTVIDCQRVAPLLDQNVIITGNRITRIGPAHEVTPPPDATLINGQGKFLIPGLWDMHIHWYTPAQIPLFIANGVTGVRFMFGHPMAKSWKQQVEENRMIGPRMVIASRIVDGPKPFWPGSIAVGTPEEGRQAIATTKSEGYDFVKVYSRLPREAYFALADEAKKQGMVFAGHVPPSITAAEASDAGQKTFEHLYGVMLACSSREAELTRAFEETRKEQNARDEALRQRVTEQLFDTYDPQKAAALFARFRKNGTWQVPTLTVNRAMAHLDMESFTSDPRLKYMPAFIVSSWNPKTDFRLKNDTPATYARRKMIYQRELKLVKAMHDAGVGILAGTDTLNPYCFPGFSLHDELALLVECGLSPRDALLTATRNPAVFLGREKDLGTVETGKLADLVLLDANPLTDIQNTKKIIGVMRNGHWYDRPALQKLLDEAETAGKK